MTACYAFLSTRLTPVVTLPTVLLETLKGLQRFRQKTGQLGSVDVAHLNELHTKARSVRPPDNREGDRQRHVRSSEKNLEMQRFPFVDQGRALDEAARVAQVSHFPFAHHRSYGEDGPTVHFDPLTVPPCHRRGPFPVVKPNMLLAAFSRIAMYRPMALISKLPPQRGLRYTEIACI